MQFRITLNMQDETKGIDKKSK